MTRTTHRILLGLSALLLGGLGVIYVSAPGLMLDRVGAETDGPVMAMLRLAGSAVLAEAVAVVIALVTQHPAVVRVVSVMLVVHFGVETIVRIVSFASGESSTLITALPQAVIAAGLSMVLVRERVGVASADSVGAGLAR